MKAGGKKGHTSRTSFKSEHDCDCVASGGHQWSNAESNCSRIYHMIQSRISRWQMDADSRCSPPQALQRPLPNQLPKPTPWCEGGHHRATAKLPLFADDARTGHILWLHQQLPCAPTSPTWNLEILDWAYYSLIITCHFFDKAYYYSLIMTCNKSCTSPKPEIPLPLRLHSIISGNSMAKLIPFLL